MRRNDRKTGKLRLKAGICIVIIIAVLIVKKTGACEKSGLIGAVAEYYGRDYSVQEVVSAVSRGMEKAGELPELIGNMGEEE